MSLQKKVKVLELIEMRESHPTKEMAPKYVVTKASRLTKAKVPE